MIQKQPLTRIFIFLLLCITGGFTSNHYALDRISTTNSTIMEDSLFLKISDFPTNANISDFINRSQSGEASVMLIVTGNRDGETDAVKNTAVGLVSHFGIDGISQGSVRTTKTEFNEKYNLIHKNRPYNILQRFRCGKYCLNKLKAGGGPADGSDPRTFELPNTTDDISLQAYRVTPTKFKIYTGKEKNEPYFPNASLDIFIPITNTTRTKKTENYFDEAMFFTNCVEKAEDGFNNKLLNAWSIERFNSDSWAGSCSKVDKSGGGAVSQHFQSLLTEKTHPLIGWGVPVITFHESDNFHNNFLDFTVNSDPAKPHFTIAAKFIQTGIIEKKYSIGGSSSMGDILQDRGESLGGIGAYSHDGGFDDNAWAKTNANTNLFGLSHSTGQLSNAYLGIFSHNVGSGVSKGDLSLNSPSMVLRDKAAHSEDDFMESAMTSVGIGVHYNDYRDFPLREGVRTRSNRRHADDNWLLTPDLLYDEGTSYLIPIQYQIANFAAALCRQSLLNILRNHITNYKNIAQDEMYQNGNGPSAFTSTTEGSLLYPKHQWNFVFTGWFNYGFKDGGPKKRSASIGCYPDGRIMPSQLLPIAAFYRPFDPASSAVVNHPNPTDTASNFTHYDWWIETHDTNSNSSFAGHRTKNYMGDHRFSNYDHLFRIYPEQTYFNRNLTNETLVDHLPWATLEVWGEVRTTGLRGSTELLELDSVPGYTLKNGGYTIDEITVSKNIVRGPIFSNFVATGIAGGISHTQTLEQRDRSYQYLSSDINMFKVMILRTMNIDWHQKLSTLPDPWLRNFLSSKQADRDDCGAVRNNNGAIVWLDTPHFDSSTFCFADESFTSSTPLQWMLNQLTGEDLDTSTDIIGIYQGNNIELFGGGSFGSQLQEDYQGRIETGPYTFPFIEFYWQDNPYEGATHDGYFNIETGFLPDDGNVDGAVTKYHLRYVVTDNVRHLSTDSEKSFIIDHPTDKDKYLVHYMIESPEARVYYRGNATLKNGQALVTLPDYFEALTQKNGRNIQLTNVDTFDSVTVKLQENDKIKEGKFIIISDNPNSNATISWEVLAIRGDIPDIVVEPKKTDLEVKRDGPYTYGIPKNNK